MASPRRESDAPGNEAPGNEIPPSSSSTTVAALPIRRACLALVRLCPNLPPNPEPFSSLAHGLHMGYSFLAPAWRPPRHPTGPPFLLYDLEVGNYYYGQGHPMKSHRIRMTQALLAHYGLLHNMQVYKPNPARERDLCRFHSDDYIGFLRSVTPETQQDQIRALKRFNVGEDCPVFDGLFNFPEFLWFSS